MYSALWEFEVDAAREADFVRMYGPDGDWARLFRRAPGYRGTDLLRDRDRPGVYITIDRWDSAAAYESFRAFHAAEHDDLDRRFELLTTRETHLGAFDSVE